MDSRRLPSRNRIYDRDKIYLYDYRDQVAIDSETLVGSVGDSVKLLKGYTLPKHELDFVGDKSVRGRHGGRRQLQPTPMEDYDVIQGRTEKPARPIDTDSITLPAIMDFSPTEEIRMMYGFSQEDVGTIYIATNFLETRGISIDPAKDYFGIRGQVYKIRSSDDNVGFLDKIQVAIYIVRKDL